MTWYTASLIVAVRLKEGEQDLFPVYENYVLIEASSSQEAFEKADEIGKLQAEDDTLRFYGRPAYWDYMGVRKMVEIWDPAPVSGVEVGYAYLEVDSEEKLNKLAQGKAVMVHYIDKDDDYESKTNLANNSSDK